MNIFPILNGKWVRINLNEESFKTDLDLCNPDICEKWVEDLQKERKADYSFGGFLENRTHLWRNHPNEKSETLIHLGTDYSVPSGTEVLLPMDGNLIHIMKDPLNKIGWGGRLIFRLIDGNYLLFGHLNQDIKLEIGKDYKKGEIIGKIGDKNVNGNWWPHLHAQVMSQDFMDNYQDRNEIDGYLPIEDKDLKNVINPDLYIF